MLVRVRLMLVRLPAAIPSEMILQLQNYSKPGYSKFAKFDTGEKLYSNKHHYGLSWLSAVAHATALL